MKDSSSSAKRIILSADGSLVDGIDFHQTFEVFLFLVELLILMFQLNFVQSLNHTFENGKLPKRSVR